MSPSTPNPVAQERRYLVFRLHMQGVTATEPTCGGASPAVKVSVKVPFGVDLPH